ncbi:rhomboid family-domain-containing protein [Trametes punicea]|nr:rhomboid family-domain-containing protein [Trametes punicea]
MPNPYDRIPDLGHEHSGSGYNPLLDHSEVRAEPSDAENPVYEPEYRFSYTDEHFNYYPSGPSQSQTKLDDPFTAPKAEDYPQQTRYEHLDYAEPFAMPPAKSSPFLTKTPNVFQRYFGMYPLAQRIEDKKRGIGVQTYPIACWALSLAMLGVLIFELVTNSKAQGSPFSFKPVVNPMLGPSSSALIHLGARFPPCMKNVTDFPITTPIPCLNDTANPATLLCSLEDICGFGGFHGETPNQWFRFITPIFLHAGLIHFLLNMSAQLTASAQVEREMGTISFLILYAAAGIFGNVLGGNFSLVGSPSVGASGAIFGTIAVAWVDLFAHWRYQYRPGRKLAFMVVELIIGIAIGFIPYVDNFAHLGGLAMGLLVGMALYPIISPSKRHRMIVITLRVLAVPLAVVMFVVLIRNFYRADPYAACSWCRYLSCIPSNANNHCKGYVLVPISRAGLSSLRRSRRGRFSGPVCIVYLI